MPARLPLHSLAAVSKATNDHPGYRQAFLDWLACAWAGRDQGAPRTARAEQEDPIVALAAAGHVLDFDDTLPAPGLSHLSAPTAPAALAVGAANGATMRQVLEAYAAGFESMGALARASHPFLYERGWHPTAVTGTVGAATAAAHLLGLDDDGTRSARQLAILGAGGLQAAFGTDAKSLQVGMAAAQGVRAARLADAGAGATHRIEEAYETVYGGLWVEPGPELAVEQNWIKAFPCCLQTHSSIEAAEQAAGVGADHEGKGVVTVPTVPGRPLRSTMSPPGWKPSSRFPTRWPLPCCTARPPLATSSRLTKRPGGSPLGSKCSVDDGLDQAEAVLAWDGAHDPIEVRVDAARGSPRHP